MFHIIEVHRGVSSDGVVVLSIARPLTIVLARAVRGLFAEEFLTTLPYSSPNRANV